MSFATTQVYAPWFFSLRAPRLPLLEVLKPAKDNEAIESRIKLLLWLYCFLKENKLWLFSN